MRESAMMGEAKNWAMKSAEDVEVGRFGGQGDGRGGQRRLTIQSGAAKAGAGQKMCDRFHGEMSLS